MAGENHGWVNLDRFLEIHERCMEQVEEYFVINHDLLHPTNISPARVRFTGTVHCHDNIEIHVNQILVQGMNNRVRGQRFRYHAQLRVPTVINPETPHVVNILRYDNATHFPDHPDAFHKHIYSSTGYLVAVEHIGRQNFPTLRNVIDEVFEWWKAHRNEPPITP